MRTKLISLNFQRNGVHGNPFFVAEIKNMYGAKDILVATFETVVDENCEPPSTGIDRRSCRVIQKDDLTIAFRGDDIAVSLHELLDDAAKKHNVSDWYELTKIDLNN